VTNAHSAFTAGLMAVLVALPAQAEVTRVVVRDSGTMGSYEGRPYRWAAGTMEGTVAREDGTTGRYRVPIALSYPDRDGNGFGFVDIPANNDFTNYTDVTAPLGTRKVMYAGDHYVGDYLRREGFTYIAVQWSRAVTAQLGPDYAMIEDGRDGWEILADAARFLRDPATLQASSTPPPPNVRHVIAFGWSRTGQLIREFVRSGRNRQRDGALVFDGFLGGGGTDCTIMNNDPTPQQPPRPAFPTYHASTRCDALLPLDGKMIALQTQTEYENAALGERVMTRHETPNYRQYEMAGVTHIPADRLSLRTIGAIRQNPISFRPVAKAMLRNLVEWIAAGTPPPPPLYIAGQAGADDLFRLELDADGNALGGLRLPHMASVQANGERAGAPLGVYTGLDHDLRDDRYGYASNAGTFDPFPPAELARRYPTRAAYVDLVRKAAAHLLAGRYILEEDHDAYISAATADWCTIVVVECAR
jgi:hypothetical protein